MTTVQLVENEITSTDVGGDQETACFVAEIKVNKVQNGIISLQIDNIHTFWEAIGLSIMPSSDDQIFTFQYNMIPTKIGSHSEIDNQWKNTTISMSRFSEDGCLFIQVPLYLHDYNISFYFSTSCRALHSTQSVQHHSNEQTVTIRSFLTKDGFDLNDYVVFRDPVTCNSYDGVILNIVEEDLYKIQYHKHDPSKGPDDDWNSWCQVTTEANASQLVPNTATSMYTTSILNSFEIAKNTIITVRKQTKIDTYAIIWNVLRTYVSSLEYNVYFIECDDELPITEFLTINIFNFLFLPEFEYKISCLIDGDKHRRLMLKNVRQNDLRITYFMKHNKIGDIEADINRLEDSSYLCDICASEINHWSCAFFCDGSCEEQHGFCVTCVDTMIRLNMQLKRLLIPLLRDRLIIDCIQEIVDYVIGFVACQEINSDN